MDAWKLLRNPRKTRLCMLRLTAIAVACLFLADSSGVAEHFSVKNNTLARYYLLQSADENDAAFAEIAEGLAMAWVADAARKTEESGGEISLSDAERELAAQVSAWPISPAKKEIMLQKIRAAFSALAGNGPTRTASTARGEGKNALDDFIMAEVSCHVQSSQLLHRNYGTMHVRPPQPMFAASEPRIESPLAMVDVKSNTIIVNLAYYDNTRLDYKKVTSFVLAHELGHNILAMLKDNAANLELISEILPPEIQPCLTDSFDSDNFPIMTYVMNKSAVCDDLADQLTVRLDEILCDIIGMQLAERHIYRAKGVRAKLTNTEVYYSYLAEYVRELCGQLDAVTEGLKFQPEEIGRPDNFPFSSSGMRTLKVMRFYYLRMAALEALLQTAIKETKDPALRSQAESAISAVRNSVRNIINTWPWQNDSFIGAEIERFYDKIVMCFVGIYGNRHKFDFLGAKPSGPTRTASTARSEEDANVPRVPALIRGLSVPKTMHDALSGLYRLVFDTGVSWEEDLTNIRPLVAALLFLQHDRTEILHPMGHELLQVNDIAHGILFRLSRMSKYGLDGFIKGEELFLKTVCDISCDAALPDDIRIEAAYYLSNSSPYTAEYIIQYLESADQDLTGRTLLAFSVLGIWKHLAETGHGLKAAGRQVPGFGSPRDYQPIAEAAIAVLQRVTAEIRAQGAGSEASQFLLSANLPAVPEGRLFNPYAVSRLYEDSNAFRRFMGLALDNIRRVGTGSTSRSEDNTSPLMYEISGGPGIIRPVEAAYLNGAFRVLDEAVPQDSVLGRLIARIAKGAAESGMIQYAPKLEADAVGEAYPGGLGPAKIMFADELRGTAALVAERLGYGEEVIHDYFALKLIHETIGIHMIEKGLVPPGDALRAEEDIVEFAAETVLTETWSKTRLAHVLKLERAMGKEPLPTSRISFTGHIRGLIDVKKWCFENEYQSGSPGAVEHYTKAIDARRGVSRIGHFDLNRVRELIRSIGLEVFGKPDAEFLLTASTSRKRGDSALPDMPAITLVRKDDEWKYFDFPEEGKPAEAIAECGASFTEEGELDSDEMRMWSFLLKKKRRKKYSFIKYQKTEVVLHRDYGWNMRVQQRIQPSQTASTVRSGEGRLETLILKDERALPQLSDAEETVRQRNALIDELWRMVMLEEPTWNMAKNEGVKEFAEKLKEFGYAPFFINWTADWPSQDLYEQMYSYEENNRIEEVNRIIKYMHESGAGAAASAARELYWNVAKYAQAGVLLVRIIKQDAGGCRVELISMDQSGSRGPLEGKHLNITDAERAERFFMNEGGYDPNQGDGAGLSILQELPDFTADVVEGRGTRIRVANVLADSNASSVPVRTASTVRAKDDDLSDIEGLTSEAVARTRLRPGGRIELKKIAVILKENLAQKLSGQKDGFIDSPLQSGYQRMKQDLREYVGNVVEVGDVSMPELADEVSALRGQGYKVVIMDDGALTGGLKDDKPMVDSHGVEVRLKDDDGNPNYCVVSAMPDSKLDTKTIRFLNFNAMALMGAAILNNDERLFDITYRLFTGEAVPAALLGNLRNKALWIVRKLPRIIEFSGTADDIRRVRELFSKSA
ncbi:MAG: hypothetical protein ABH885_06775 [Candidatus Omnitrophota bacterium]